MDSDLWNKQADDILELSKLRRTNEQESNRLSEHKERKCIQCYSGNEDKLIEAIMDKFRHPNERKECKTEPLGGSDN